MHPINLHLGDLFFFPFYEGLYFCLAIVIGFVLGRLAVKRVGLDSGQYENLVLVAIIGAMVGGRLFSILFWGDGYYWRNPAKILAFWEGGISITGGIAGGLLGALIFLRFRVGLFWDYLGTLAPVILLAQGLGRIGCFLNGDAFGAPTGLPWGVRFQRYATDLFGSAPNTLYSSPAWEYSRSAGLVEPDSTLSAPLHPTQLYEAGFDFALALALWALLARKGDRRLVALLYVGGYSLFRFGVEYLRADKQGIVAFNTSAIQLLLLAVGLACLAAALWAQAAGRRWRGSR